MSASDRELRIEATTGKTDAAGAVESKSLANCEGAVTFDWSPG